MVSIVKLGNETECSYYQKTTDWGCMHRGDALVENFIDYAPIVANEIVSIADVRNATFYFSLEHYYDLEKEMHYGYDSDMNADLTINIAGENFGPFSHSPNLQVSTHIDESVNPEYNGDTFVTVKCDEQCNCEVDQSEEICNVCEIRAVLNFPSVTKADTDQYYGYHNDVITVNREGFADTCDFDTIGETDWGCKHDGDARIWYGYDDEYDSSSEKESVRVCDGSDGNFEFTISHYYPSDPNPNSNPNPNQLYVSSFYLSINGEETVGDYQLEHDVEEDNDGNIQKTITVNCDSTCNCVANSIT